MTKKIFRPYRKGDGGTILMPRAENVAVPQEGWEKRQCPVCGTMCYISRVHRRLMKKDCGLRVVCVGCATRKGKRQ